MKYCLVLLSVVLSACGPSCQEQGGHWVQDGFYYIWVVTDIQRGTGHSQANPNFVCKKDEK
mgnify:CR=1 FL=1